MRKKLVASVLGLCLMSGLMLSACGEKEVERTGYIRIDGDTLFFDEVEFLFSGADSERLKELGIDEDELMDGYYIYNEEDTEEKLRLDENTEYSFYDWNFNFLPEKDGYDLQDYLYVTDKKSELEKNIENFGEYAGNIPYFVDSKGKYVTKVTERYIP